jgi:phosphoenolpyruvate carboxykinase (ATP)
MSLRYTRAIIDAIHDGSLDDVETVRDAVFGLAIPTTCPGVPRSVLIPRETWQDKEKYDETARRLAILFRENFVQFEAGSSEEVLSAAPSV